MNQTGEDFDNSTLQDSAMGIPFCFNSRAGRVAWLGHSLAALNGVEVVVNVIHVVILLKMPSLRGSAYLILLCHLAFGDVASGAANALRLILSIPDYFERAKMAGFVIHDIVMGSLTSARYYITTAAALERYTALCRPMAYDTSLYITKLNLWLPLLWGFAFVPYILRGAISPDAMCYSPRLGPVMPTSNGIAMITFGVMYVLAAICAVAWIRVVVELWRMSKRSLSSSDQQVRRSTFYMMVITIGFYLCFLPPYVTVSLLRGGRRTSPVIIYLNTFMLFPLYGVLNTVLYGWMNEGYRKTARELFALKRSRAVAPERAPASPTHAV